MNILSSILHDFKSFFNLKTKQGRIKGVFLIAILIVIFALFRGMGDEDMDIPTSDRAVSVSEVSSFSNGASMQLIGTVSATNRAAIQSEASGLVVVVPVKLGDSVSPGQVIARIENASEYAALLQAEGVYEGAVAAAQINDVSVLDAENNLTSAHNSAYTAYTSAYATLRDIYSADLDLIVADPENIFRTPGVSLRSSSGLISEVGDQFKHLGSLISGEIVSESTVDSVSLLLADAQTAGNLTLDLIRNLQFLIDDDAVKTAYEPTELTYLTTLSAAQSQVNTILLSLKNAEVTLLSAKTALEKSKLGGTTGEFSSANAQVKQALGALKAAQANYNKTLLRSPIAGVVNSLDIQSGDFVSNFQKVAEVANNDALEVTTFVGQADREHLSVGQKVMIEDSVSGIISTIAPAVNTATGKIELKIQSTSSELVNGDTVTIAILNKSLVEEDMVLQVPLTAVKFTADAGSVFSVENGTLVTHAVTIGAVRDTYIEILSGVTADMKIVVDARGLSDGQQVSIITN